MLHLPGLITDLALILGAAAVTTLIFRKLKQPVVLGYILAGLLVGPHFKIFPTIAEINSIRIWADIGVIFLLFGLGLEFSFKKLVEVGAVAVVTALIEISCTMFLGFLLGRALGWGHMDCLFLGGILAIASTTIIIRAFDELNVKTERFTGIVTGVLIVEDLVAVVLMVVLSTVSVTRSFAGAEMVSSVFKLVFFLVLWFVSGIFFLPTLLKAAKRLLNEETLLILALSLCFLMVVLAANAGFSSALGAFIMGSILAETTKAEKIEHLLKPLKSLFGAIFFVSVGMLIDPNMLGQYYVPIAWAIVLLLIGKPLLVISGALLTGQPLKTSIQAGMSLSQIGEFSFIIATLGLSLNVTSAFLYPIAVAVSVITTFTTPFMIRLAPHIYEQLNKVLPVTWQSKLNRYSVGAQNMTEVGDWRRLIRLFFINVTVLSVIILTVILIGNTYIEPWFREYEYSRHAVAAVKLLLIIPFLWALAFRRFDREAYARIWVRPLQRGPLIILMISRIALALFFLGLLFERLYSTRVAVLGVILTSTVLVILSKKIRDFYSRIELRFLSNLNEREEQLNQLQALAPWDTHLSLFVLSPHSPLLGLTLQEARVREKFGVNIAMIERGNLTISVPSRDVRLYPYDRLSVIGTDEQLRLFRDFLESARSEEQYLLQKQNISLHHFTIQRDSVLNGKSIRYSGIRERTKGLVVGVERQGEHLLNPESDFVFQEGDVVWVVGHEKRILILARDRSAKPGTDALPLKNPL